MSQLSASLLSLKPFYHKPASLSIRIKKGLHFCFSCTFQDFVQSLKELSLIFKRNKLLESEILRLINETITSLEMLSVVSEGVNRLVKKRSVYSDDVIHSI